MRVPTDNRLFRAILEVALIYLVLVVAESWLGRYLGLVGSITDATPIVVVLAVLYVLWRNADDKP